MHIKQADPNLEAHKASWSWPNGVYACQGCWKGLVMYNVSFKLCITCTTSLLLGKNLQAFKSFKIKLNTLLQLQTRLACSVQRARIRFPCPVLQNQLVCQLGC